MIQLRSRYFLLVAVHIFGWNSNGKSNPREDNCRQWITNGKGEKKNHERKESEVQQFHLSLSLASPTNHITLIAATIDNEKKYSIGFAQPSERVK
jgi:hypothetical protein